MPLSVVLYGNSHDAPRRHRVVQSGHIVCEHILAVRVQCHHLLAADGSAHQVQGLIPGDMVDL